MVISAQCSGGLDSVICSVVGLLGFIPWRQWISDTNSQWHSCTVVCVWTELWLSHTWRNNWRHLQLLWSAISRASELTASDPKGKIHPSIHPSIRFLYRLIRRSGRGGAGAYPSGHWAKGGLHPGQVASPSNLEPSRCEATVLTTTPPCSPQR